MHAIVKYTNSKYLFSITYPKKMNLTKNTFYIWNSNFTHESLFKANQYS